MTVREPSVVSGSDGAGRQILDVEVILPHIPHPLSVG